MSLFPAHTRAAFSPFFDATVIIEGTRTGGRTVAATCAACVFDNGVEDPFADISTESSRRRYTVEIRRYGCGDGAWPEEEPPQAGDVITLERGEMLTVFTVNSEADDVIAMEARTK